MSVVEFPEIQGRAFDVEAAAVDVDEAVAAPAELVPAGDLVEWTPERAASMVRAFGMGLHMLDPAAQLQGGEELWRATSQEASEIGAPLSRILARYEPARRLAPLVDEVELGAAFVGYAKRNVRERGRLVLAERDQRGEAFGGERGEE